MSTPAVTNTTPQPSFPRLKQSTGAFDWAFKVSDFLGNKAETTQGLSRYAYAAGHNLMKYDTTDVVQLGKKLPITEPPFGMMLLWIFPVTIGNRLLGAIRRDKDKTGVEVGDILRRDPLALVIFMFLLKPLTTLINKAREHNAGIKLVHKNSNQWVGKAYGYSELENLYRLNSAAKLEAIVAEGHGKGLRKAAEKALKEYTAVLDPVLEKSKDAPAILENLKKFQALAEKMENLDLKALSPEVKDQQLRPLANEAFTLLQQTQQDYQKVFETLAKQEAGTAFQVLPKLSKNAKVVPKLEDMLGSYAKRIKLPSSMLSFAIVSGLLGLLPVWINSRLSSKRKSQPAETAAPLFRSELGASFASQQPEQPFSSLNRRAAYQALKQSSPLSSSSRTPFMSA